MDKNKVPVLFQPMKNFNVQDTRFTKVKMWLMHLDENLNGSVFTKEVVERAIPTLTNTPIMGSFNSESGDFEGHEMAVEKNKDGEIQLKNLTVPYGVIPEDNSAQFEERVGDDGVTRTYLTVEGLLWNKWQDGINVITSKNGKTGQSMEITDHDGHFTNDAFHFTEFKFNGACLLGDEVEPAMKNSTVELAFSDKVSKIINEKLAIYAKSTEEGGSLVEKETQEKINETEFEDKNTEETPVENTEEDPKGTEETTPVEPAEPEVEETPEEPVKEEPTPTEPEEEPEETQPEEKPVESEEPAEGNPEEEIPVVKEENITDARIASKQHESEKPNPLTRITIGENVYTVEEASDIIEKYFALQDELHKEAIDEMFNAHSENLTDDELKELKKDAYTKTKDEVETSIYATIGRKSFSSKQEDKTTNFTSVKVSASKSSDEPYGGILSKYKQDK